jgi:hypothetical protein
VAHDGFLRVGKGGPAELEESPAAHVAGRLSAGHEFPGDKTDVGGGSLIQGNQLVSSLLLI